jgi:aminoglycoside 6'-N-acetyltransferase
MLREIWWSTQVSNDIPGGLRSVIGIHRDTGAPTTPLPYRRAVREEELTWSPLTADDLPVLAEWLAEPGVVRWWHHESSLAAVERDFGPSVRGEEPGEDLVVLANGRPIGLLQRARIADYADDLEEFSALVTVPPGAVEIDYLIADPADRGRGLGTRLVRMAVARTWTDVPDASAVLVAVVAGNVASWRALEKAGLQRVAEGDMLPENPADPPLHYVYRADRPSG